jgi:DNA-3-methyladenine glycosylase II
MPVVDYERARRVLMRRDPILGGVIKRHGPCTIADTPHLDHFTAICRVIVGQQLSTKAAATIFKRFVDLLPERLVTPSAVIALTPEQLREVGLSRQKMSYLVDLGNRVMARETPLHVLDTMTDEQVIETLTGLKGLGRWSADMFLMFRLHRPDVLPVGDLGIVRAMERLYGLRKPPGPERMEKIAEAWKPYRSIACWYLWRSLENTEPKKKARKAAATPVGARSGRKAPSKRRAARA